MRGKKDSCYRYTTARWSRVYLARETFQVCLQYKSILYSCCHIAPVAQWTEQLRSKEKVPGSNPGGGAKQDLSNFWRWTERFARRARRRGEQTITLASKKSGSLIWWNYTTLLERILNGIDRLRFAPAERSGAAEFPPHPPSAAPSREARIFLPPIINQGF